MRLLDRYLLRELCLAFAYTLMVFLVFWVAFDLLQELPDLQHDHMKVRDCVEYYLWKLPELLTTVLPVALLLALLYTLTNHARHNELTAMRSAGISLGRICLPHLLVGVAASLWLMVVSEVFGPRSADAAEAIRRRHQPSEAAAGARVLRNFGFVSGAGRRWQSESYDLETGEMTALHVGWQLPGGSQRQIVARHGEWTGSAWEFQEVIDTTFPNNPSELPARLVTNRLEVAELTESPDQIRSAIKVERLFANLKQAAKRPQLSVKEILDYRRLYPNDKRREGPLTTQLHGRLAAPWTCLVVVFIAIPFGAPSGRRNAFVGVAAAVFICFTYFILMRFGLTLGTGGRLPGWLAAWGPNILFATVGLILTSRVR
jgi:lipopolysaccharide export system permease protein